MDGSDRQPLWQRLPRWVYWTVGAAISFSGALIASNLAEGLPLHSRYPLWIAGTAAIFLGLWVLSLGTKSRLRGKEGRGKKR